MIDKFIKHKKKVKTIPKHLALSYTDYTTTNIKVPVDEFFKNKFSKIKDMVDVQISYGIPVMTIYLLSTEEKENVNFSVVIDTLTNFFNDFAKEKKIFDSKIKISFLGKWYNLPSKLVDSIKKLTEETRDYDSFFLNFCINYDGQEEIIDACRLIARRIKSGKLDPDNISKEMIKENLYSSYFLPPELMIVIDGQKHLSGFLLWDSTKAKIYFSDKKWADFSVSDVEKALMHYEKWKIG